MHLIPVRKRSRRRGQALIEGALTLLLFLITMIAIIDFGQIMFIHAAMTERVRDAARRGITSSFDATTYKNLVRYGVKVTTGTEVAFMGLTDAQVDVFQSNVGTPSESVTVRVIDYDMNVFTPYLAGLIRNNTSFTATIPSEYVP